MKRLVTTAAILATFTLPAFAEADTIGGAEACGEAHGAFKQSNQRCENLVIIQAVPAELAMAQAPSEVAIAPVSSSVAIAPAPADFVVAGSPASADFVVSDSALRASASLDSRTTIEGRSTLRTEGRASTRVMASAGNKTKGSTAEGSDTYMGYSTARLKSPTGMDGGNRK